MLNGVMSSRYYLFSISNLLAAFGGGLILGKATDVIINPALHGGSILAFFIGSVLGLSLLQTIPKNNTAFMTKTFSISCSFVSLVMYFVYALLSGDGSLSGLSGIIFFILLTVRFSLWFFSRVKRASESSGKEQSIAWVEFGYYFGMVLGLVVWKISGFTISLGAALILDVLLQCCAGLLDIKGFSIKEHKISGIKQHRTLDMNDADYPRDKCLWCRRMAFSVIALTVGIQVIIFHLAHMVSSTHTSPMLAVFYSGVATSALVCNKLKLYLSWNKKHITTICVQIGQSIYSLKLLQVMFVMTVFMLSVFININKLEIAYNRLIIYVTIFMVAFLYELISLSLLDRIGYEESQIDTQNLIMKTYGMMGVCSAIGFWLLISFKTNMNVIIFLLLSCMILTFLAIFKRPADERGLTKAIP